MIKSYKFKLTPNKTQQLRLNQWLGTCRFVYNLCLGYKKSLYSSYGISISKNEMQKELSQIRKEYDWIGDVYSQTIQDVTDRLDKTYQSFFKGGGFPKFAKRGEYSSFAFKQGVGICENTNKIKLPSLGKISFRRHRDIPGEIKYAILKKEYNGWFISLICETDKEIKTPNENIIGIDLGIKDFLITSNGDKKSNPKHLRQHELELKSIQRNLARKKKRSENRKKNIFELQKVHAKVRNTRKDFLQKLSTEIINESQVIIVEDLQVKNMVKNHKLAKSISDAGWGMFRSMIKYKCEFHGRVFCEVTPHNTSRKCSCCGWIKEDLTLDIREWVCQECGVIHDRDINAAENIKQKGIKKLQEAGHVFSTYGDMVQNAEPA